MSLDKWHPKAKIISLLKHVSSYKNVCIVTQIHKCKLIFINTCTISQPQSQFMHRFSTIPVPKLMSPVFDVVACVQMRLE